MAFDRRSGIPYSGDGRSDGRVDRCAGWLFFFFKPGEEFAKSII